MIVYRVKRSRGEVRELAGGAGDMPAERPENAQGQYIVRGMVRSPCMDYKSPGAMVIYHNHISHIIVR